MLDAETDLRVSELARRLANVIRPGAVEEADYAAARVRVRFGDTVTGWLPWLTRRAGGDVDWWAPETGEQVLVLSPSGDPAQGWVLPAGYSDAAPAPESEPDVRTTQYQDGTVVQYDRASHKWLLDLSESTGTIKVTNGEVTVTASGGDLTVEASGDTAVTTGGNTTVDASGNVAVTAAGQATVDAPLIAMNDGTGVVTGECVCHFTGLPHGDISSTVTAGK